MKKRRRLLSEAEFAAAITGLAVGQQTIDIARGVLVQGRPQADYVARLGVTKGAVSQAVNRVRAAIDARLPPGYQRVTAVLPTHQAFIVQQWEKVAKERLEDQDQ